MPDETGVGATRKYCNACVRWDGLQQRVRSSAMRLLHKAIKRGELPHPSTLVCVDCGRPARQYDHRDYTKPTDVAPVCRSCNCRRGPALVFTRLDQRGG